MARKLEKLEGAGADRSYSDDEEEEEESEDFIGDFTGDFPSLDSTCSGHTSPDASITLMNGKESSFWVKNNARRVLKHVLYYDKLLMLD